MLVGLVEPPREVRIDVRDSILRLRRRVALGAPESLGPERRVTESSGREESVGWDGALLVRVDGVVVDLRDGHRLGGRLVHRRVGAVAAENRGHLESNELHSGGTGCSM